MVCLLEALERLVLIDLFERGGARNAPARV